MKTKLVDGLEKKIIGEGMVDTSDDDVHGVMGSGREGLAEG